MRPRVNALLKKALENPITFIKAGEGCGKSTSVKSFLEKRKEKVIWISLTQQDNDPSFFWENICQAVVLINAKAAGILKKCGFPFTQNQILSCISAFEESEGKNDRYIIIAEDCHHIYDPRVIKAVTQLLNNQFKNERYILISRRETSLNLIHLLSKGLLSRINTEELHFTKEEIMEYFLLKNMIIKESEAAAILYDTEGWILAVVLISEDMKKNKNEYKSTIFGKGIVEIIKKDFYDPCPDYLKYMLTIASLFESWSMEALEKIAEQLNVNLPADEDIEKDLGSLNPLLRYDPYTQSLKIHHAFLELLKKEQETIGKEETRAACIVMAKWCMDNNLWIEAAKYYSKVHEYEGLIRAIHSYPRLYSFNTASVFLQLIENIVNDRRAQKDDENFIFLCYAERAGILLNLGRYKEAEQILNECITIFTAALDEKKENNFTYQILYICYSCHATMSLINYIYSADISRMPYYFKKGYKYQKFITDNKAHYTGKINIASYLNVIGKNPQPNEFEKFISVLSECIPYTASNNFISGSLLGMDKLCKGEQAFFYGNLDDAEQYLKEGIIETRRAKQFEAEAKGYFYLLRIYLGNGDYESSIEVWDKIEYLLVLDDNPNRYALYDISSGWIYAHLGKTEKIAAWLKEENEESGLNILFSNLEFMVKSKYLYAERQFNELLELIKSEKMSRSLGIFHFGFLELKLLEAASLKQLGMEEESLLAMEEAYKSSRMGSELLFEMPFIELGEDMRDLCRIALGKTQELIPIPWLENIRNKSSAYEKKLNMVKTLYREKQGEEPSLPLLSLELQILEKMSVGLTREDIAQELSMSLNTIKNTIKSIYEKLGALNQADAIRIALKNNLI